MAFQTPITIAETLRRMHNHEYVLPAIQREFVWDRDRIVALFDSLMRGYPIGSFLFWKVTADRSGDFVYYDFIREFHRRNQRHCPRLPGQANKALTAILDGQQRLTSLNIGLSGSYAEKLPRLWWNNPNAYPKTFLYLHLTHEPKDEDELQYRFAFWTDEELSNLADPAWFRVSDIMSMDEMSDMMDWLADRDLGNKTGAGRNLGRLHKVIHTEPAINFFEETDQDLDRVLDIFIRVNSGGMVLSHSDLLLSIATAQWTQRDAREEVHRLVDEMNTTDHGFDFSKDLVLKAGLVMTDARDIRFRVQNFNRDNMAALEKEWPDIASALKTATLLLSRFGFSTRTLPSNSVLIPLADWVHRSGTTDSLVSGVQFKDVRKQIKGWVLRSQLKAGVFGSGLDTLLARLRVVVRRADEAGRTDFPVEELEAEMARLGKPLRFAEEELEDLVETSYGNARAFAVLTTLYPGVEVDGSYHLDHVYPRSRFTPAKLRDAGIDAEDAERYREVVNFLPNLQLMEGPENESKQDRLPHDWADLEYPDVAKRREYLMRHDLEDLQDGMRGFLDFYRARREHMLDKLRPVLVDGTSDMAAEDS